MPNLLPSSIFGSHFPRKAGRLIWASVIFAGGLGVAFLWVRRPKRSNEPATWAQTFVGAMGVWLMLTLGYGVIPSEWIIFGNSYLNFSSSTFLLRRDQWGAHLPPFDITRDKLRRRSRRRHLRRGARAQRVPVRGVAEAQGRRACDRRRRGRPGTARRPARPAPRREERVSAYGRPVTTTTEP